MGEKVGEGERGVSGRLRSPSSHESRLRSSPFRSPCSIVAWGATVRVGCDDQCARGWYAYPVRTVRGALWGQAALRLRYVPEAGTRSPHVPIRGPGVHASAQVVAGGSHAECSVEPKEYGLGESLGVEPKANALGDGSFRERFPKVARSPESLVFPLAIRHPAARSVPGGGGSK